MSPGLSNRLKGLVGLCVGAGLIYVSYLVLPRVGKNLGVCFGAGSAALASASLVQLIFGFNVADKNLGEFSRNLLNITVGVASIIAGMRFWMLSDGERSTKPSAGQVAKAEARLEARTSAASSPAVPTQKPAAIPANLNADIQRLAQMAVDLNKKRESLNKLDPAAVAAFNKEVAAYTAENKRIRELLAANATAAKANGKPEGKPESGAKSGTPKTVSR